MQISFVKDILAAALVAQKHLIGERFQSQSISENWREWRGFCVNALYKATQIVRGYPFQLNSLL